MTTRAKKRPRPVESETSSSARFRTVPLIRLEPARLNDRIYKAVQENDPATVALAKRMTRLGWLGAMAVTSDWVIVSGHRRRVAAQLAGINEVVVEVLPITSADPRFPEYLVTYNEHRKKTPAEEIREQVAITDPAAAYAKLIAYRQSESQRVHSKARAAGLCILTPAAAKKRSAISAAKQPMLAAAIGVIEKYRSIWPLTLRQVHYRLLTLGVRRDKGDRNSTYGNTRPDYQDLSRLLVRARLAGLVEWDALEDETRPQTHWQAWDGPGPFVREQLDDFLKGYRLDLQASQPAHVILFVEKLTVQAIAKRAANPYHVPVVVGKGYPSITCVHEMAELFKDSGKDRAVLLVASDFDPEGQNIGDRLAASLRDEFGVSGLTAAKVALTGEQIREMDLPPALKVKKDRGGFVAEHGNHVWELEALEPDTLQRIIGNAIESTLDMDLLRRERLREIDHARELEARRKRVFAAMGEEDTDDE